MKVTVDNTKDEFFKLEKSVRELICYLTAGMSESAFVITQRHSHPASGLDSLVDKVRIGFSGHEAAGPLCHIEVPVLQNDPALTDDHHRETSALHSLKDIHLHGLR